MQFCLFWLELVFIPKQFIGSDFTNYINLLRCGVPWKGSCFFSAFPNCPFLDLLGAALMLALFCSESKQGHYLLFWTQFSCWDKSMIWRPENTMLLKVGRAEQPAFYLPWAGSKITYLMLEISLCWIKFFIFQVLLQNIQKKSKE